MPVLIFRYIERVMELNGQVRRLLPGIDTKEVRAPDSRAYALLNDSERTVSPSVMDALQSYDVRPIPWSKRLDVVEELTT